MDRPNNNNNNNNTNNNNSKNNSDNNSNANSSKKNNYKHPAPERRSSCRRTPTDDEHPSSSATIFTTTGPSSFSPRARMESSIRRQLGLDPIPARVSSMTFNSNKLSVPLPWYQDAKALFSLALPTVIIQLSFVVPPFLAASFIGRKFGVVPFDGYTLAWSTGNLSTLALLQGIFNACDTLGPRAFGAQEYPQVGWIAMRGITASFMVIILANLVTIPLLPYILSLLRQDAEVSADAVAFYAPYVTMFLPYAIYEVLWKFLAAQNLLMPLVIITLICICILLPTMLHLAIEWFGFVGAAWALTAFYMMECALVLIWLWWWEPPVVQETWPGISSWRQAFAKEPFLQFLALATGGMLVYLEWTFWEVLTVLIGTFGVLQLSAHEVARQLTDMAYILPLGVALALAIRLGSTLPQSVVHAKALAIRTYVGSAVLLALGSVAMYIFRDPLIALLITEPAVVQMCHEIWWHAVVYFWAFSMFGITLGLSIGLGMQWIFGLVTVTGMWVFGMPATYYYSVVRRGGLNSVWACIWPPYIFIIVVMGVAFYTRDWNEIAQQALRQTVGRKKEDVFVTDGQQDLEVAFLPKQQQSLETINPKETAA